MIKSLFSVSPLLLSNTNSIFQSQIQNNFSFSLIQNSKTKVVKRKKDSNPLPQEPPELDDRIKVPSIKNIVIVSSAKGGVGKSTVSTNLSIALSKLIQEKRLQKDPNDKEIRVGLLDADIYGPSIHKMFKITDGPEVEGSEQIKDDKLYMVPHENFGIKIMSMGSIVDDNTPIIWRGPMIVGAIEQLLTQVKWKDLDCLVIDMPPGTGDILLTVAQRLKVKGAVIVSTPQDVALIDVSRGVSMFNKLNVPILGIVENMSYFQCGDCGKKEYIFGNGGAKRLSKELSIDFLGELPIETEIRERSDNGEPIMALNPNSNSSKCFSQIATKVLEKIEKE